MYTVADPAWQYWNQAYCTSSTTGTNDPWILLGTNSSATTLTWGTWNTVYEETQEQKLAREAADRQRLDAQIERNRQRMERVAEEQRRAAQADARAEELLLAMLTGEQAATRREHGWFEVRGSRGHRFRIRPGLYANVDRMPDIGDERELSLCAHPYGVPDADAHLAQMLALVTDEDAFLAVANVHYRRPAPGPAADEEPVRIAGGRMPGGRLAAVA